MPLYPEIEPFNQEFLKVSDIHTIYFEECGNPNGKPAVFIHGGPGGGIQPSYRQYFNPDKYRLILVDQRGCGKSTPFAELKENTTQDLIRDFEKIRKKLNIDKWMLFGGSWGSTLGLAYAQAYPEVVTELVLRGIFLGREKELSWLYQHGASMVFPDMWEKYIEPIPVEQRKDFISAYHSILTGDDEKLKQQAAIAWSVWEASTSKLFIDKKSMDRYAEDKFSLAFARIECHYFKNKLFIQEAQLLEEAYKIKDIPGVIVQGRYDMVCPAVSAWDLHKVWPKAELDIIADAGHSIREPGILEALVRATDKFTD
ncbi:prolyl aminopeptidase [Francisella orientalis]|uniref:Proline iminopeptidase n=1 Tax=Francisella orientalis TaxID=299583 RepID=A0AAP6XBR7_9GAMM|nr:prolyl aminopeptidase [Francisella orientalis]AFJ44128.1 prolyl aminopeptidase [Francisella orientalis str. Toba 04]AHB97712.1 proline iminopeptidase [Francisella orientalis LADL 07-285A]AKN86327.1 Proline iminopeptidase [Francisella orientalis FNO12]AKN87865.1 Proline iminopeptidase [Francisella orientalis FNO24]AKN89404.1 Proline iminopeptidase [Francisella orientalis]